MIELGAAQSDDLFGDSVFAGITRELLGLLDLSLDRDSLIEGLNKLRPRGAKSFRGFVTGLASTGGDITIAAAGATLKYTARELPAERLQTLVAILNNLVPDEVEEIRGRMRLYRADMDRKVFGLHDELAGERYEGNIANRALSQVDHAAINELYDVVISAFAVFDEAVGERRPRYVLEHLVPLTGDDTDLYPTSAVPLEDPDAPQF